MSALDSPGVALSTRLADHLIARWSVARPFLVVGFASITAGGLIAAVTRPTAFELGSWLAAFLVLVGGIAQIALGVGQAWMADQPPRSAAVRAEVASWNLGLIATIIGSLASAPLVTAVGAVAIVVALVMFLRGVGGGSTSARWPRMLYRAVIAVVLISTPVGLALAWVRRS